ncbi:hypothetical protein HBN82_10620 [Pseudomonas lundensis]|nr:hypothetical protein [Pseudomonas lundensis]
MQAELPHGAPLDLAILESLGVSPQLAARYVTGGWLLRLGHDSTRWMSRLDDGALPSLKPHG